MRQAHASGDARSPMTKSANAGPHPQRTSVALVEPSQLPFVHSILARRQRKLVPRGDFVLKPTPADRLGPAYRRGAPWRSRMRGGGVRGAPFDLSGRVLSAVDGEPLRESAHRTLMLAHLAEGNASEAIRQYGVYSTLLRKELGMDPSGQIRELARSLGVG